MEWAAAGAAAVGRAAVSIRSPGGGGQYTPAAAPSAAAAAPSVAAVGDRTAASGASGAAASGAANGMQLALNVGAMLLAFVALIALLNGLLGGIGGLFDYPTLTLQEILGYLFAPVAWLLGVPWNEAIIAGSFIGQKLVVNEFVAYLDFINYRDTLSAHTQAIVTFALCGFANLSSIAILLGGLGGMAPSRRKDIARLGLRAVLAGSMANLMSAAIAGFFLSLA